MNRFVREVEDVNPNLITIMNLFTALIPFLLMSAVFFRLSIVQISVPVASESGETDIAKEENKVTLNLQIFPDRYDLSASSDSMEPALLDTLKATIKRDRKAFMFRKTSKDRKALEENETLIEKVYGKISQTAYEIKGKYVASDTVIVVPEEDIPYEDIVGCVDAVRRTKLDRDGQQVSVTLFPKVVLSSRVK